MIRKFDRTARLIGQLKLSKGSMWCNKANAFTLFVMIAQELPTFVEAGHRNLKRCLDNFEANPPANYTLAAREAVNNRPQRQERHNLLRAAVAEELGF